MVIPSLANVLVKLFVYHLDIFSKIWLQCTICNSTCQMLPCSYGASRRRKEHGFLKGCKDVGNNEDTCQSAEEDNQDLKRVAN